MKEFTVNTVKKEVAIHQDSELQVFMLLKGNPFTIKAVHRFYITYTQTQSFEAL